MKKKINDDLTLYFNDLYPYKNSNQKSIKKNLVTVGVGGNVGDVMQRFKKLFHAFNEDGRFSIVATSPILKNPPFGYLKQDYFYNSIIILKTDLSAKASLRAFQRYELRFKRIRTFQDAPRTLDIDIIFYNKIKLNTEELTIPHKGYKNRDSVLIPLTFLKDYF
ncbi:MAG: 2-amino-4-hydroxy-6-hydroxymethyldihydropteridine diphosphokinase [Campylobacterota bacterium]|nr:2-amino-4-hydroxy-6-hydroxymethyldihydropteridine diphosphokinase [Campylobacterota bacterium]